MAEPTPQSPLSRWAKSFGVGLPADIAISSTWAILWHLISGKGTPPKGDVRLAIAKIAIPALDVSDNADRRARALARREEVLQRQTRGFAFLDAQGADMERAMNAVRSTEDWTVIFANVPPDQWIIYIPKPEDVPHSTWEHVSQEAAKVGARVASFYDNLEPETKAGFQRWSDWAEQRRQRREQIAAEGLQRKKHLPWVIGSILLAPFVCFALLKLVGYVKILITSLF